MPRNSPRFEREWTSKRAVRPRGPCGQLIQVLGTQAGDGARTHDPQLGKLMLYQLSYAREA